MRYWQVGLSLAMALWCTSALPDVASGKAAFEGQGCTGCHYTEGPAREKTIEDQLAKAGPELWYAGSKFNRPWLEAWLTDPKPIRLLKYNSLDEKNAGGHPTLVGADATAVTDFLMSLTTDAVTAGVIKPKSHPKGKLIFKKKMPCSGCHQYEDRKKVSGGLSGPSLVGAGARLNPDWIYAYLSNPTVFKPVRMMPVFAGLMSPKDMEFVSAYVASFKGE
ncbi:MAG: c-type cytochrome [Gammaproteobacteria bacterium]|jgi:mono/diheme cytochrome c family protein|nr:c-type cytochrome [Gammaproteobacteria bacterium]MBT4494925.1 c-type cytochrome [Gammaproteobacteria bacterium]MBT7370715.1 c-type cytochrome [Gammaproteobacteria bacterium]